MTMLRVIIKAIREELAQRRFFRDLAKRPPAGNAWADAMSRITTEQWLERAEKLGNWRF